MQGGDISGDTLPCILVLFEGLLGLPPERKTRRKWKYWSASAEEDIAAYEINMPLLHKIRHVKYPVEVVTFLSLGHAQAIERRLDDLHALVRRVWPTTPLELARIHIQLPDVGAIYDPDPLRAFATYGSLGRHLLPENAAHLGEQ